MLQQIMEEIHNYFIHDSREGEWKIEGGMIAPDFLQEGQRFLISGSVFNDGIFTYHAAGIKNDDDNAAAGLTDEDFDGEICALAVPPAVTALSAEISSWVDTNADVINSPYQSESFGGYSYTRASGKGASAGAGWQDVFAGRLNRWRKVAF